MEEKFNFQFSSKPLPIENLRDFTNILRQDIKFKYLPFRIYYKYRAYKYAKTRSPELNIIHKLVKKNKVSLDVGANLGLYTFFMAKSSKKVYAFEPNPYPLRYLKNLADKNVEIMPVAVGNTNKKVQLKIPKRKKGWSSNGATLGDIDLVNGINYLVQCYKIDTLNIKNIGLIKIDVEGFENQVIKGAINTIKNQRPNLIIENEWVNNENPQELFKIMTDLDYEVFYCDNKNQLQKIGKYFDFKTKQRNPKKKDNNYVQNFIFIYKY